PISSTNTSIPGSRASAIGSPTRRSFERSRVASLGGSSAHQATSSIGRPARSVNELCVRMIMAATAEPTVPNPARPTLSGSVIRLAGNAFGLRFAGDRQHVVQPLRPAVEEPPEIARGLADALFVLDQRDAHETFAVFAKPDAGRYRDLGLFDQHS